MTKVCVPQDSLRQKYFMMTHVQAKFSCSLFNIAYWHANSWSHIATQSLQMHVFNNKPLSDTVTHMKNKISIEIFYRVIKFIFVPLPTVKNFCLCVNDWMKIEQISVCAINATKTITIFIRNVQAVVLSFYTFIIRLL